jgi:hypothetical protein
VEVGSYEISDLVSRFWRKKFACFTSASVRNLPNITLCKECVSFVVETPGFNGHVTN